MSGTAFAAHSAAPSVERPVWLALLESASLVSSDVLENAVRESDGDAERTAEWLVSHGCIPARELAMVQAESVGMPFIEPGDYRIDFGNRALLPEELTRAHSVFPLFKLERIITLGVTRSLDLAVLDQIRLHTGCEVDQCFCAKRDLLHLIEWAFGSVGTDSADEKGGFAWEDILNEVADAPAVKLVNVLINQAAASRVSDIHVDAEEHALRVRFRVDGVLREVPAPPKSLLPAIVSRIKVLAHMDIAETRRPQDGHFKLAVDREELDIRVSTLPSAHGEAVVLRLLHGGGRLLSLEELGMDTGELKAMDELVRLPHGMLFVTGPTGSGKTTTLYSVLSRLDRARCNILTLEDPVEVRLEQVRQTSVNPKAGLTFQTGLRAFLRQDPDVIMIGEVRDRETAEIALQAALTGHLVLSTLHTNSAVATVARLLDMGVPEFLVASAVIGVLAQRLCRRLCPHCAQPVADFQQAVKVLPQPAVEALAGAALQRPVGCKRCGNTGYDGRVGIYELFVMRDPMRRAILDGADEHALVEMGRQHGMRSLAEDGLAKIRRGVTTIPELLRVVGRLDNVTPSKGAPSRFTTSEPDALPRRQSAAVTEHHEPADAAFDVAAYERLLGCWLRGPAGPTPAEGRA